MTKNSSKSFNDNTLSILSICFRYSPLPSKIQTLFSLMIKLAEEQKITALLVTHDWDLVENNHLPSLYADLSTPAQAVFLPKEPHHAAS